MREWDCEGVGGALARTTSSVSAYFSNSSSVVKSHRLLNCVRRRERSHCMTAVDEVANT